MKEKLIEAKSLIDEGKLEEAKAKIDEVLAEEEQKEVELAAAKDKKPIGGGGNGIPPIKK